MRLLQGQSDLTLLGFHLQARNSLGEMVLSLQDKRPYRHLKVSLSSVGTYREWVITDGVTQMRWVGKNLALSGQYLKISGEAVPNQLQFILRRNGKFDVIAKLEMETYLYGVLQSEMPSSWPEEALKAQAVAARSYAMAVKRDRKRFHYDVEATMMDQVFRHLEKGLDQMHPAVVKAVNETRGMVLAATDKKVLKAYYHSDCGGGTVEPKDVWGGGPPMGTAKDSFCPMSPHGEWKYEIGHSLLAGKLQKALGISGDRSLVSLTPIYKGESARLAKVVVVFTEHPVVHMTGHKFRQAVGFGRLKSTQVSLHREGNLWRMSGRGFGHGVGLCQWGTRHLAKSGWSYEQILNRYYQKARMVSLREVIGPRHVEKRSEPVRVRTVVLNQ